MPDEAQQGYDEVTDREPAGTPPIEVSVDGAVDDRDVEYGLKRMRAVFEHVAEPVLFARLRLTRAADPARERPAEAHATFDIRGDVVRAHVTAHDMREAADLLQRRLLDQLGHRAERRRAQRRSGSVDRRRG
jgi:hypothetical protein